MILLARRDRSNPRDSERVVRALESATRSTNGNGLRFRRARWPTITSGPEFAMSESDLRDAFPRYDRPVRRLPRANSRRLALGRRDDGRPVGPPIERGQGRHLAVLGETGMGKSSLLTAICQGVAGEDGLVLFDPFGDTARAVRAGLSRAEAGRVRWIDPSAVHGLNALSGVAAATGPGTGSERGLNDLVHALRRVREGRFVDGGFWGPRLEEMLGRALRAASSLPGGTLVEAHALLAAEGRGFRQVPAASQDVVRALADRIRARPEDADGARRLLFEVVRDADLVRLLCAREPSFSASELVRPREIVLIAGDASVVGESTARYLLSVFLALLWSELLARPAPTKTWVVLDEAQWFAHEALAEMLRMARRCDVHIVLATQAVGALPEPVRESLWTNVADFVIFRGSPADARELGRSIQGVRPESILALPRGHAYLLLGKGQEVERIRTARAVGLATDVPPPVEGEHRSSVPRTASPPTVPPGVEHTAAMRAVLAAVERAARCATHPGPIRISLSELRDEADPTGRAVRELGTRLARSGVLLASGRDEHGTFWWLDGSRVLDGELGRSDGLLHGPGGEA
jgi:Helicase HerA, central domain